MANEESSDRGAFFANYKNFSVAGGGGPAMVLAIGTPIAVMVAVALLLGSVTGLLAVLLVLFGMVAYGVLTWLIVGLPQRDSTLPFSDTTTGN